MMMAPEGSVVAGKRWIRLYETEPPPRHPAKPHRRAGARFVGIPVSHSFETQSCRLQGEEASDFWQCAGLRILHARHLQPLFSNTPVCPRVTQDCVHCPCKTVVCRSARQASTLVAKGVVSQAGKRAYQTAWQLVCFPCSYALFLILLHGWPQVPEDLRRNACMRIVIAVTKTACLHTSVHDL